MNPPSPRPSRGAPPVCALPADAKLAVVAGRIVEVVARGTTLAAVRPLDHEEPLFVPASALIACRAPGPDGAGPAPGRGVRITARSIRD